MQIIKEALNHLRQVTSTRGGNMTIKILLVSGAFIGGMAIALKLGAIPPLQGLLQTFVIIVIFIFVSSCARAIYILITNTGSPVIFTNKDADAPIPEVKTKTANIDLLGIWSRRISLGGTLLIGLIVYVTGWFFVIKYLVSPTIHQISNESILWEMGTSPNSIGNIIISFMMFIFWIIMPFMLYMDFDKKQRERDERK